MTDQRRPIRIQRKRVKGWKKPEGAVYVGRGSKWGNPFAVGSQYVRRRMAPGGGEYSNTVIDHAHAVRLFKRYTARETRIRIEAYQELRGKDLACWCALVDKDGNPFPCHAEILLELANP